MLKSQESIKTILNSSKKMKNSIKKSKSNKKSSEKNKHKSESKIKNQNVKEMKITSNDIKSLAIGTEKEFEYCDKSNESYKNYLFPSFGKIGSNDLTKNYTAKNYPTVDLISKIIELNNESILKNSPRFISKRKSFCQNDSSSSNKIIKLIPLLKNKSFSKMDKKKRHNILFNSMHDSNMEDKLTNSKITNKPRLKNSQKSLSESKNFDKYSSSSNTIAKSKKYDIEFEKKSNYNKKSNCNSNQSSECKKHPKNVFFKLPIKNKKNNKEGSTFSLSDHHEDKYCTSLSDQGKKLIKSTIVHFGLSVISDNKNYLPAPTEDLNSKNNDKTKDNKNEINLSRLSNGKKELTSSILGLDIDKLKKEMYEYENNDITDAINRLPTLKYDNSIKMTSDNEKNKKNKKSLINNVKYLGKKKSEKIKKLNKKIKLNKERYRTLQHKKYVYDSLDDEEFDDVEEKNFYFEPDSIFIYIIDSIIFFTSFIELFYFPIYLAKSIFNTGIVAKDFLFYFTDVIFIIDLIVGFFKAYYNFDEYLVKKSSLITKNYVKNWFGLDFICCIPLYSILKSFGKKKTVINNCYAKCYYDYEGNNLYYLFVLIKIFKILKVLSCNIFFKLIQNQLKKNNFINDWGNVLKYLFLFISILNISSSIYIFVARNSYPNWILAFDINKLNFIHIYICSIHHIITTMTTIGYGDIVAQSLAEKIFEIISLIVSTCFYSWIVSSASNYIKKMNEKYIKFEKKKEILDEIKVNYPLINDCLYDRIYRLLSYGKSHVEVDKNIILDSLPYSIRNELLIQMYDPIINNFKLFRYFDNSEFIIRIVSLFKPMVCSKGDILVNEGDFVEDIIFNKSGMLSVDVCVDLNKQKESIEEYLIKYNLGKTKNTVLINQDTKKRSISPTSTKYSFAAAKLSQINTNFGLTSIDINSNHFMYKKSKNVKNLKFIKILYIRRKEDFGAVLMFLNEKSPLYIRVHSKKAELFLLRKTDVVNLSSDYPNMWDKMNKKSIFNFEQIRSIITRKLTNFCNYYGIQTKLLSIKKDTKNCLYYCPNYLMPIPDDSRSYVSSDLSKSKNTDNMPSEFQEFFESGNTNYKASIIKEESNEDKNVNTNLNDNQNSLKNTDQNKKNNNNRNNKFLSAFSKQNNNNNIEFPSSPKNDNNSMDKYDNYNSNITIISNSNNCLSPVWNDKLLNPVFVMGNSFNESIISFNRKKTKKTKSSDYIIKNKVNTSLHVTLSNSSKKNEDNENIRNQIFESNEVNNEVYSNENFEIVLQKEDDELMSKKIKSIINTSPSKSSESINQKRHNRINNKFSYLKISTSSNVEIKSSYDNLNVFTNYRYIIDNDLRKKTKHFLGVECGFLSQFSLSSYKFEKSSNRRRDSKKSKKIFKVIKTRKSLDSSRFSRNNVRCFSYHKSDDGNLSNRNEVILSKRTRNFESMRKLDNIERRMSKSLCPFKQTSSVKSKNYTKRSNVRKSISDSSGNNSPKKKNRRRNGLISDVFRKKKNKRRMDLISEYMQRDRQNLNNPSEFYADLFSSFVVNAPQINGSEISNLSMVRIPRYEES